MKRHRGRLSDRLHPATGNPDPQRSRLISGMGGAAAATTVILGARAIARVLGSSAEERPKNQLRPQRARVLELLSARSLSIAFQPIQCLKTGSVVGAEALSRFADTPAISPEQWFADAHDIGCGTDLELLAIKRALQTATQLPPELYISVNLSPATCLDPRLEPLLNETHIASRRIVLEVTEGAAVDDYSRVLSALAPIRNTGVRLAVDDACAGYASMLHILKLKPDFIKLDRRIVAGIDLDPEHRAFGAAMAGFATATGATLVAEGIETATEHAAVRELGIHAAQGYFLGRPTSSLEEWARWAS